MMEWVNGRIEKRMDERMESMHMSLQCQRNVMEARFNEIQSVLTKF